MAIKQRKIDLIADATACKNFVATPEESVTDLSSFPNNIPFGRLSTLDEIAEAAVFLASDEHDLTGIELIPDTNVPQA